MTQGRFRSSVYLFHGIVSFQRFDLYLTQSLYSLASFELDLCKTVDYAVICEWILGYVYVCFIKRKSQAIQDLLTVIVKNI